MVKYLVVVAAVDAVVMVATVAPADSPRQTEEVLDNKVLELDVVKV